MGFAVFLVACAIVLVAITIGGLVVQLNGFVYHIKRIADAMEKRNG